MKFLKGFFTAAVLFFSVAGNAQNWDIDLVRSINQNESSFKNDFTRVTSNSVTIVNIAAPLTLLTVGLAKHNKELQKDALYMVGGYALSAIITHGTKVIVQRERPFITYPDILKRTEGGGYSFPSGHTSAAFYAATSISILFPKWYVIAPSLLWASAVGYSRMYQGVHYPTDVLAGAAVGAGSAWVTSKFQHWMDKKNGVKKAAAPAAW